MEKALTKVEFESLSGIMVQLDEETVMSTLTRGNGKVTPQEVAMFLRTCQAKKLDPLENGEVYLIKYDDKAPAQLVVGCHAYVRRADMFPDYRGFKAGITVVRRTGNATDVVQKEGCCVYKALGEELIGGWCRVFKQRNGGAIDETFVEVSLEEYSSGKSNWTSKPATMIRKVAISQALRAAFPNDYEGLYTDAEMQASGAIPAEYTIIEGTGEVVERVEVTVTQEQRQELFKFAKSKFGNDTNAIIKELLAAEGLETTEGMPVSAYERIMDKVKALAEEREQQVSNASDENPAE